MIDLKDLTDRFAEIIGGIDFPSRINDCLFSDKKEAVFERYIDLVCGDLSTDNLQRIYQYYCADRENLNQDFTPTSIAKLCSRITETSGEVVWDICSGSGSLTIQKWVDFPDKLFVCMELDESVIPFLLFNLSIRNIKGWVVRKDILTNNIFEQYELIPGTKYSSIKEVKEIPDFIASSIVSNPPYNVHWNPPEGLFGDTRFFGKVTPPASNANFAFVMTAIEKLSENGRVAFVLPNGCLSSENEKECREYLLDNHLIERVISLPEKMFESTSIPVCVLVLSHGNNQVMMFDASNKCDQEERKQRGQFGGAAHEGRVYTKIVNVLPEDLIETLCTSTDDIEGFSKMVDISTIKENESNLTTKRYVGIEYSPEQHRPFKDIMNDINRIAKERSAIKVTCNETLAKETGLYELAIMDEQTSEIDLDKTFEILDGHYEKKRWITLTKSKVFKVESQDKDQWSFLLRLFIPQITQHVQFLNIEENRLLAEMRDALLPELMNPDSEISKKILSES